MRLFANVQHNLRPHYSNGLYKQELLGQNVQPHWRWRSPWLSWGPWLQTQKLKSPWSADFPTSACLASTLAQKDRVFKCEIEMSSSCPCIWRVDPQLLVLLWEAVVGFGHGASLVDMVRGNRPQRLCTSFTSCIIRFIIHQAWRNPAKSSPKPGLLHLFHNAFLFVIGLNYQPI